MVIPFFMASPFIDFLRSDFVSIQCLSMPKTRTYLMTRVISGSVMSVACRIYPIHGSRDL
jgi:hypothetical protein